MRILLSIIFLLTLIPVSFASIGISDRLVISSASCIGGKWDIRVLDRASGSSKSINIKSKREQFGFRVLNFDARRIEMLVQDNRGRFLLRLNQPSLAINNIVADSGYYVEPEDYNEAESYMQEIKDPSISRMEILNNIQNL